MYMYMLTMARSPKPETRPEAPSGTLKEPTRPIHDRRGRRMCGTSRLSTSSLSQKGLSLEGSGFWVEASGFWVREGPSLLG